MSDTPTYDQLSALCAQMAGALEATQFGFNHRRCPVCAGWNVGPHGETDKAHTKDCPVAAALTAYRTLSPDPVYAEAKNLLAACERALPGVDLRAIQLRSHGNRQGAGTWEETAAILRSTINRARGEG